MKKHISTILGHSKESTAFNSQKMIACIAAEHGGYEELKIHLNHINGRTDDEVIKQIRYDLDVVENNSLFILQLPTWNVDLEYDELFLRELRKKV